jgi:CHRD domain
MRSRIFTLGGMAVLVMGSAGHTVHRQQAVRYIARLKGSNETPAHEIRGTGTADFRLDGKTLYYMITVSGLSGTATMAHIHVGAVGVAGPVVWGFPLKYPADSGTIDSGSVHLVGDLGHGVTGDSLITLLNNGNAYVNVHTGQYPGGEIRGQIVKR